MLYETEIKQSVLDTLDNRVSSLCLTIGKLLEEGYVPNNKKIVTSSWLVLLTHAYENIDLFDKEQQQTLDTIYNTIIRQ